MEEYTQKLMSVFQTPFRYCPLASTIFDANENQVVDIRGWGFLNNNIGSEAAVSVQNHLGEFLTKQLNSNLSNSK